MIAWSTLGALVLSTAVALPVSAQSAGAQTDSTSQHRPIKRYYEGECRQTLADDVLVDGPCRIVTVRSWPTSRWPAGEPAVTVTPLTSDTSHSTKMNRYQQTYSFFGVKGDQLIVRAATPYSDELSKNSEARYSGGGTLTDEEISLTVTKEFINGPKKGKSLISSFRGKFDKESPAVAPHGVPKQPQKKPKN